MCWAMFPRVAYVGVLLIERGIHRVLSDVSSGGLCRSFAYRTRLTPCVARFFLGVWLMSDFCRQNKAHTVCSASFPRLAYFRVLLIELGIPRVYGFFSSSGLCRSFAYRTKHTLCVAHFPLAWLMSEFHL